MGSARPPRARYPDQGERPAIPVNGLAKTDQEIDIPISGHDQPSKPGVRIQINGLGKTDQELGMPISGNDQPEWRPSIVAHSCKNTVGWIRVKDNDVGVRSWTAALDAGGGVPGRFHRGDAISSSETVLKTEEEQRRRSDDEWLRNNGGGVNQA
ncbi:hypothetical protein U1Q18_017112 [Sarracenia purpurea var. burkii]